MPQIGDTRKAVEVGRKGTGRFIYKDCPQCHVPRWIETGKRVDMSRICRRCSNKTKRHPLTIPRDKITSIPYEGEIRNAFQLGNRGYGYFIWTQCKICGKYKWVQIYSQNKKRSDYCRLCAISLHRMNGHHFWNGGRIITHQGYIKIKTRQDSFYYPMADNHGYISEHRLIMAQSLGRCLQPWEIIHHKNGDKQDNKLSNLELTESIGNHSSQHSRGYNDGYTRGYLDGQLKYIKELESKISI